MFILHDTLLICFLIISIAMFIFRNKKYHKYLGTMIKYTSYFLFINGSILAFYVNGYDSIIFISYGFSFLTYAIELGTNENKLQILHIISSFSNFVNLVYLYNMSSVEKYFDFLSVMYLIPFLHFYNIFDKSSHIQNAINFSHLSLLGITFSFTSDIYWLRSFPLPNIFKLIINQLPILFVIILKNITLK